MHFIRLDLTRIMYGKIFSHLTKEHPCFPIRVWFLVGYYKELFTLRRTRRTKTLDNKHAR